MPKYKVEQSVWCRESTSDGDHLNFKRFKGKIITRIVEQSSSVTDAGWSIWYKIECQRDGQPHVFLRVEAAVHESRPPIPAWGKKP